MMKGCTYRHFQGEPLFPFGYGLSYTKFKYQNLSVPKELRALEGAKISVEVQNVGESAGDEVVEPSVKALKASTPVPIRSLEGFKRVHLKPGERRVVEFTLEPRQLSAFDSRTGNGITKYVEEPGPFEIAVGGIQPETKAPTTAFVAKEMKVVGGQYLN
jgi:beta-glucosidase